MKNGYICEAQKLFDEMPERNTVTWNAMIRGYFQNGHSDDAVWLYNQMPHRDIFSYNTMIAGLMQCGDVSGAKEVFDCMPCKDVVSWNSMISGFVRNGFMSDALSVFDKMVAKDVISWNLVISGLVNIQELELAEKLFGEMGTRDVVSWTVIMSGLVNAGRIVEARRCFHEMPVRDVQAWNKIIEGYIKVGNVEIAEVLFHKMPGKDWKSWYDIINGLVSRSRIHDALRLFSEMPDKCNRSWNSVFLGLVRNGLVKEAHALLEKTPFQDVVSQTNMILGYFDIGEVENAVKVFELMTIRDTTAWNATIFGLGENDHGEDGIKLYIKMRKENVSVDEATLTSVLTICSNLPSLELGKQAHAQVIKIGIECFISASNALITMYARSGNMDSALIEFSCMRKRDIISWNSIICGLACHGHGEEALEMFRQMRMTEAMPNQITFIGVLSACSHAGLVDQGKYFFDFMKNECHLKPTNEHYTCIVDLLGKYGLIKEALTILDEMRADGFEVPSSVWGALLGACRIHKNLEVGEIAGENVLKLEPSNSGVYMILAEMYMGSGKKLEAEKIWWRMREKGVKKQPGCSWIEVNNNGNVFIAGDSSHPRFSSICCVLDLMHTEIGVEIFECNIELYQDFELLYGSY
ncbi:Pentatricopeptide repeat-containing protein [Heracleum sosnowskyi]|uniref:Pentatricopeptide repeat-containing protein n=1 Tax=Heracleum sosnowskyi TaxID=360622 RepID=A0AAD8IS77_9APIA|nr:Pentatricopeptide repeat-containing protein [Heracleum sosnowskyi]